MTRPDKKPGTLFGGRFPHSHRRVRKKPASTTTSAASTPRTATNVKGIGITRLLLETRPYCSPGVHAVRHRINNRVADLAHARPPSSAWPMAAYYAWGRGRASGRAAWRGARRGPGCV